MKCTLCDIPLTNKADDYFFICGNCGAYVKNSIYYLNNTREKYRYEEHNNDVCDPHYQNFTYPITREVLNKFSPEHRGLDFGCGTAPVISKMLQDKGYHVTLFDPYFHPDPNYLNSQYDYIFSCEVIEHFSNPKKEIDKLIGLLKPGGYLYVMTHLYRSQIDFNNWYYRRDLTHIFIYTKKTILFIAEKYGLSIEKLNDRLIILKKIL